MPRGNKKKSVQRPLKAPRLPKVRDKVPHDFVELIHQHLTRLARNQEWLVERMDVSPTVVWQWLNKRDRHVSRGQVSRLAYILATEYQAQTDDRSKQPRGQPQTESQTSHDEYELPRYDGIRDLEAILAQLLHSLGYRSIIGERDLVWRRLTGEPDRTIRVGWTEYYPLAYAHAGDLTQPPLGIARVVTEKVTALLGVRVEWHHFDVTEITPALLRNRIDMICCEYIRIDPRFFDVWVSDPLPALRVKPALLVHADHAQKLLRERRDGYGALDYDRMLILHSDTSIGRCLANFLTPPPGQAGLADVRRRLMPDAGAVRPDGTALRMSLANACADVLSNPVDAETGRVRCLATDSLTAHSMALERRGPTGRTVAGRAAVLEIPPPVKMPLFSVGFGLHPEDADMFGRMLNRAIENLRVLYDFGNPASLSRTDFASLADAVLEKRSLTADERDRFRAYFGPIYSDFMELLVVADAMPTQRFSRLRELIDALNLISSDLWGNPNEDA